ncbi:MAG: hypothetical protein IJV15_14155 [Lachnospiraceae bacterium]|nr:hypothetical protein [Lachnospiraceae bacterium]
MAADTFYKIKYVSNIFHISYTYKKTKKTKLMIFFVFYILVFRVIIGGALYTFFEEDADALSGKTLIPFSTHAGSGLSGFDSKLAGACPDSTVGIGLAISGADTQNNQDQVRQSVNDWIDGLGY